MLDEGSISVMTYEGFAKIGFNEDTQEELLTELYDILNQGGADDLSDKKKAGFYEKLEKIVGTGLKGTMVEIEKLGLDYVCYDEAHAMKKVFTSVKSRDAEEGSSKRGKSQYSIQSGTPSDTALKGFMISNYILKTNNYRNVVLLTATPFTNSPLEVFSMLAIVGYRHIELLGLKNINDFFDNFIDVKSELVINHKLKPEFKQVIKGFNNLPSLQRIVLRFFNYKDSEDVGVVRPSKIVIPYTKKLVNGNIVTLEDKDQVTCNISMSAPQKEYMEEVIAYVEGRAIELGADNNGNGDWDEEQSETFDSEASEIDESSLDSSEKAGVKALRGMNFARNIALSPYLYQYQRLGNPDYKSYINTSPKLQYVVGCVESVKKYHESKDEPVSGQVIYMDRGLKYFSLIEEYLVKVIGFKPHEVGQISSKMSTDKKRIVQDLFLGRKYNNKTQSYESVSDDARIKVLIGSSSIKEGMNLQKKSTVLYNCFLDWNPTDIIQLQGRIWRQQNEYLYVRIVNPLVIDSMDIFMFQKLEEKTARLNSIWSNDGKSVMKLEEMDTEEIKMSLVKDPKVIAGFESKTKKTVLEDNKNSIKVMLDRLKDYKSSKGTIENRKSDIDLIVNEFAPQRVKGSDVFSKIKWLVSFFSSKKPKDNEGKHLINRAIYHLSDDELKEYGGRDNISDKQMPYKPYWFTYVVDSKRLIDKEYRDLLQPRGLEDDSIQPFIDSQEAEIKAIEEEITFVQSEDFEQKRVEQIVQQRLRDKVVFKDIPELVSEFERQNDLLSLIRPKSSPKKSISKPEDIMESDCQVVDENGVRKIDDESIDQLTKCVEALPQTKDFYIDDNGDYTKSRLKVHDKIIAKFKKNIVCVKNDNPIAILTGGSPASGKSTFLKTFAPYLLSDELVRVDADEIRAMLPEYKGWNATATHLETKDIVNRLLSNREVGMPCLHDLIYDGTMNSVKNYLPLIGTLKSLGYQVFIVYMDKVPYSTIRKRMLERYKSSGRFVPISVIDDFFSKGKDALNDLKNNVDGYMVVDASNNDYDVIEEGGVKLPTNREYSKLGASRNKKVEDVEFVELSPLDEMEEIKQAIIIQEMLVEGSVGEERKEIEGALKVLRRLL
jgi:predicted ABC-type ATPase